MCHLVVMKGGAWHGARLPWRAEAWWSLLKLPMVMYNK